MIDTSINFLMEAGKIGSIIFGIIVLAFIITFIVITGCMVLFLIYKQVFFPKSNKSESLQYTLFKNIASPFITNAINDFTKETNNKIKESKKKETEKVIK